MSAAAAHHRVAEAGAEALSRDAPAANRLGTRSLRRPRSRSPALPFPGGHEFTERVCQGLGISGSTLFTLPRSTGRESRGEGGAEGHRPPVTEPRWSQRAARVASEGSTARPCGQHRGGRFHPPLPLWLLTARATPRGAHRGRRAEGTSPLCLAGASVTESYLRPRFAC